MVQVICENCGKEFEIENKYYNRSKTKKFYCCISCSCEANRKKTSIIDKINDVEFIKIVKDSKSLRDICSKLGYKDISGYTTKAIKERCFHLGIDFPMCNNVKGNRAIKNKTKGEILNSRKSYQSYRSAIRKDAEKTFDELDGIYKCCVCGYDKHIEIAHVKSVSDFESDTLISEINHINNIIPLCPNHHWEFDNKKMDEKDIDKIKKYINERLNSGMEE